MEIRSLDPADLEAALDIRIRSLGAVPEAQRPGWREQMQQAMAADLAVGCYDGARLAAAARIIQFRQWWGGHSLPMAGVAGVVVAPEDRGRGVGRQLMRGVLERAAAHQFPISTLYPATVPLYRGCGWEFAGVRQTVTVPAEAVRTLATRQVPLRRVGADDVDAILAVVRRVHREARSFGPIDWPADEVRQWLAEEEPFAYLAADGFLAYQWDGQQLAVEELIAGSAATARALWSLVGSGSSVATTIRARLNPYDAVQWLAREEVVQVSEQLRWMLRLVDVPSALAARGYPAPLQAEVTIAVDDPLLPANTGSWRVAVAGGRAQAQRVAPAAEVPQLGAGGLAAMYAGVPVATLRTAGLLTGGDGETDALLEAVFTARPYLLDYF